MHLKLTYNNSPWSKQMMKRQEIQNLHASQQEAQREQLISAVHQRGPVSSLYKKHPHQMRPHPEYAKK